MKTGRPRDTASTKKAKALRRKKLSYRQISTLMGKSIPSVYRWINR